MPAAVVAKNPIRAGSLHAFIVFVGAALLFATNVANFAARPTDISALRVLDGEIPYRDFWTIYAPGCIYVTAAAFAIFGRNLIVSNLLGIFVSALAVAVYFRLVSRVAPRAASFVCAFLLAAAFYNTGYYLGLTTFPPAFLFLLLGAGKVSDFVENNHRSNLLLAGISFGICTIFKHDVGAYACLIAAITLLLTKRRILPIFVVAATVVAVILPFLIPFLLFAKKDLIQDLIVFPIRDFPWARREDFPGILPSLHSAGGLLAIQRLTVWAICNFPFFTTLISLPFLWQNRKRFNAKQSALLIFFIAAFPFFWYAAHIQINTHPNTLTALAALLAAAAWATKGYRPRLLFVAMISIWTLVFFAEPLYKLQLEVRPGIAAVNLPHLAGIRARLSQTAWMRKLADAMKDAAPADRPILVLSNRNDVLIYCQGSPYWLSDRKIVTRYHELHPGVTDTEPVQKEMLNDIAKGPLPLVVREHRFPNSALDAFKKELQEHLPVGATLLDDWVRDNYRSGSKFGMYEVMIPEE